MSTKPEIERAVGRVIQAFASKVRDLFKQVHPVNQSDNVSATVSIGGLLCDGKVPYVAIEGIPTGVLLTLTSKCGNSITVTPKVACAALSYVGMNQAMFALHGIDWFVGNPADMPPSNDALAEELANLYWKKIASYIRRNVGEEELAEILYYAD